MNYECELGKLQALQEEGLFAKPFYAERLAAAGGCAGGVGSAGGMAGAADGGPFASYEAFRQLPFMTKDDIRRVPVYDRTATESRDVFGIFSSSGTTGDKTFYIYNRADKRVHSEFVRTYLGELGIGEDDLGGIFAPIDTGVMAHTMVWEFQTMGAGYVNCPVPSPQNMLDLLHAVPVTAVATRPNVVSGPFYAPDIRGEFAGTAVRKLLLGGGFLTEERRALLEEVWGAQCYCLFGMSEMFGPMAAECRCKDGLHYLDEYLLVELLDPVTVAPVPEGEPGVAVYTSLWNKGFPLLRYWTDDVFVLDASPCACGSTLPRLRYRGRMADCCVVDAGRVRPFDRERDHAEACVFAQDVESALFGAGLVGEYACRVENGAARVLSEECDMRTPDESQALGRLQEIFAGCAVTLEVVPAGTLDRASRVRIVCVG